MLFILTASKSGWTNYMPRISKTPFTDSTDVCTVETISPSILYYNSTTSMNIQQQATAWHKKSSIATRLTFNRFEATRQSSEISLQYVFSLPEVNFAQTGPSREDVCCSTDISLDRRITVSNVAWTQVSFEMLSSSSRNTVPIFPHPVQITS